MKNRPKEIILRPIIYPIRLGHDFTQWFFPIHRLKNAIPLSRCRPPWKASMFELNTSTIFVSGNHPSALHG